MRENGCFRVREDEMGVLWSISHPIVSLHLSIQTLGLPWHTFIQSNLPGSSWQRTDIDTSAWMPVKWIIGYVHLTCLRNLVQLVPGKKRNKRDIWPSWRKLHAAFFQILFYDRFTCWFVFSEGSSPLFFFVPIVYSASKKQISTAASQTDPYFCRVTEDHVFWWTEILYPFWKSIHKVRSACNHKHCRAWIFVKVQMRKHQRKYIDLLPSFWGVDTMKLSLPMDPSDALFWIRPPICHGELSYQWT